jgi:hypothetical protein
MATFKGIAYDNTNVRNIIPSSSDIMQLLGGLQVDGATTITGNLTVNGTTTTVNSQVVTADRYLHMNNDYMADAIEDGGIVFTVDPENNELNGNLNIASATTIVIGSNVTTNFAANDIIQITSSEDSANDGLYVIHSSSYSNPNTTITIKDASTNVPHASVSAFVKTALTTNADDDSMKIRVAKIGVIKTDSTNGVFEIGFSSSAPITYNDVLTAASSVTASAIAADDITAGDAAVTIATSTGNITIDAQASDSDIIFKGTDGGADTTFLTLDGSEEGKAIFNADVTVGDDLSLLSDSAVLGFGADLDTTLTHTDGTGLTLNGTNKLCFGDTASFIHQSSNSVLTIDGEATIDLNASTAVLVSNDLKLNSDSAVLGFGADNEITLTHSADAGLILNGASAFMFRGSGSLINSPATGDLDIDCTDLQLKVGATFKILEDSTEVFAIDTDRKVQIGKATGAIEVMAEKANTMFVGSQFTGGEAIATALVVRMHTNGKCLKAASSSGAEARILGISTTAASGDGVDFQVATVAGSIVDATFSAAPASSSAGLPCFLDTNSNDGKVTLTAPTGSGLQVVQVGFLVEDGDGSATARRICLQVIDRGAVN